MSEQTADTARAPLGRAVVRRLRLPGPPLGAPLPSRIGSLASSVQRFAAATSRPVDVRRALMGPGSRPEEVRPPRWWTGEQPGPDVEAPVRRWHRDARGAEPTGLPDRRLPRAARAVESESSYTPGGMLGRLRGQAVRVRRHEEVVASGSVFSSADRTRMTTAAVRRQPAPPAPGGAPAPIRRSVASAAPAAPARSGPAASAPAPPTVPAPAGRHAGPAADVGRPSGSDRAAPGAAAPGAVGSGATPSAASAPGAATRPGSLSAPGVAGSEAAPSGPSAVPGAEPSGAASSALGQPADRSPGAPDAGPASASAVHPEGLAPAAGESPGAAASASAAAPSAPVLRRASWQLRPRSSRLADVAARHGHHAVPSAPPRAAARLDGRTPDLRRAVAGGSPVAAASVALLDAPPSPAVREGWAATSHVVRRRSLERAEEAAAAPLRRAAAHADGRAAAGRAASSTTGSAAAPAAPNGPTSRTGAPAAPSIPTSPAPSTAAPATTARTTSSPVRPATRGGGASGRPAPAPAGVPHGEPGRAPHATAGTASGVTLGRPGPGASTEGALGSDRPTSARPSVHRSVRALGAVPAAPTALPPLSDLLTIRRRPGRGAGAGPLATGLGEPAEIRPASGNLAAVPAGPGVAPIVRRTPAQLADPAAALASPSRPPVPARPTAAAPARRVEGAVPLLTPALRSPAAPGTTGADGGPASDHAPGHAPGTVPSTAPGAPAAAGPALAAPGLAASPGAPGQPVRRSQGRPATVRPPLAAPAGRANPERPAASDPAALLADPVVRRLLRPPAGVGAAGGSLLERTAAAFASDAAARPAPAGQPPPVPASAAGPPPVPASGSGTTIRRTPQGLTMTKTSDWAEQLSAPATPAAALSGVQLDAVVDAVVERIEQRVVDELERRGRRDGRSW